MAEQPLMSPVHGTYEESAEFAKTKRPEIQRGTAWTAADSVADLGRVVRTEWVTPRMRRITVASPELGRLGPIGYYRSFAAYFSKTPGGKIDVPVVGEDGVFLGARPLHTDNTAVRAYTIRRFDGDACEFDVDMVVHSHGGVGGMWARSAVEGDVFGFMVFNFPDPVIPACDTLMLIGDETSIPHFACIVEDAPLPPGQKVIMLLEVEDEEEQQSFDTDLDLTVIWAYRKGAAPGAGVLQRALRDLDWPEGRVHASGTGESKMVNEIRSILRHERGLARQDFWDPPVDGSSYMVHAYWRRGRNATDEERLQMKRIQPRVAAGDNMMDILEDDLGS